MSLRTVTNAIPYLYLGDTRGNIDHTIANLSAAHRVRRIDLRSKEFQIPTERLDSSVDDYYLAESCVEKLSNGDIRRKANQRAEEICAQGSDSSKLILLASTINYMGHMIRHLAESGEYDKNKYTTNPYGIQKGIRASRRHFDRMALLTQKIPTFYRMVATTVRQLLESGYMAAKQHSDMLARVADLCQITAPSLHWQLKAFIKSC